MRTLLIVLSLATPFAASAGPDSDEAVDHSVGTHHFLGGETVELTTPSAGGVYLAGEYISVRAPVGGGVYALGSHVDIEGPVEQGLFVAASVITVGSSVHRSARILGETITLTPTAQIDGATSLAGHSVTVAGHLGSDLRVAAHDVRIDAVVAGDVEAAAESIEVGPEARIGGRLRYRGERSPVVADGAQIGGGIERLPGRYDRFSWHDGGNGFPHGFGRGVWVGASFAIGALLLLLGPVFMTDTSAIARRQWAHSLGVGFMVLVTVPIAVVILFITLIGIPAGLLAIALYATVIMLGYVCGAVALGDFALDRVAPSRVSQLGARILALLGALLVLAILRHVRLIGGLAVLLVLLTGIGALLQRMFRAARPPSTA